MEELITLSGVARKTANVVLGTAYGIQAGFVVDTHVARLAQRLGLTTHSDPVRIEDDLCRTFAREVGPIWAIASRCMGGIPVWPSSHCALTVQSTSCARVDRAPADVPWELRADA